MILRLLGHWKKNYDWVNDNVNQKIHKPPTYRKANYVSNETVSIKTVSIVSIIPPYDKKCVPQTMTEIYHKKLSDYYDPLKKN